MERKGGVQKQKKRKTVRDTEVEVNKSTDSETDYQANMASPAMTRPSSAYHPCVVSQDPHFRKLQKKLWLA